MRGVGVLAVFFSGLLAASAHSCSAQEVSSRQPAEASCGGAQKALERVQRGDASAINSAIRLLQCYEGSQAEDVKVAVGDLIISYPRNVFASMHANKLPAVEVADIASSAPWRFVDNSCGLKSELSKRLSVIESLAEFHRERAISIEAMKEFMAEVTPHCATRRGDKG
jgi:hypothetical protein